MRPPDFSEDDEDDDEDESEDEVSNQRGNATKKSNAKLSSSEDDDDDEEDDEEEEEKFRKRKASGKSVGNERKRPKASTFFDEEAEASEDDDEDDDDEPYGTHKDPHDVVKKHYTEEDIRREQMEEAALEIMRQQDRRRAQAGGRFGDTERSVAEMAQEIEDRHRMQRRTVNRTDYLDQVNEDTGGPEYTPAVAQQSLVPSVSDPSLWMVSCATGKEMDLVFQIMNKCIAFARQGRPLGISATVAAQSKGRIYIESFSEPAVMEAILGVRGLLQYTMRLVPIQDMTTVMTVVSKKKMGTYSARSQFRAFYSLISLPSALFRCCYSKKERLGPYVPRSL